MASPPPPILVITDSAAKDAKTAATATSTALPPRCNISTPAAAVFALLLGYLKGVRGEFLFETEYAKLLDCPKDRIIELAETAARRGWIVFKKVGDVIEVLFPNNITSSEMELVREQS